MGTSNERAAACTDYYKRGQYIPGLKINAMDILAVLSAVQYGKQYVLEGNGPLVYEYETYRFSGHSMSDPGTSYRTRQEIQEERGNDPITNFRTRLLKWGILSEDDVKGIDKGVRGFVDKEVHEAEEMPVPENTAQILFEDIYMKGSEPHQRRGRTVDETVFRG